MPLAAYPRFPLVTGPTPLQRAERLERALGANSPRIFIKRDDLTGLAYGGNKARKLEYLVADALDQRATVLVTEGVTQSNHARMTAAAALLAGLKCVLILDARNGADEQGNLLLDRLMGADIRIVDGRRERIEAMAGIADELREAGESPYVIPTGGSVPLGSLGYVRATLELDTQLLELGEASNRLYFPTGSQGTLAGLVVGSKLFNSSWMPVAVAVEGDEQEIRTDAMAHVQGTLELLQVENAIAADEICIDAGFTGAGYGIPTAEGLEAIHLLARTEAIFLDPVYTGKAMSALIAHVRAGGFSPEESVIFLHTGGTPSLFVHRDILLEGV
jgi:D-cysteine desulfhydrase family pyridoxal phosphate-dependent enzyme